MACRQLEDFLNHIIDHWKLPSFESIRTSIPQPCLTRDFHLAQPKPFFVLLVENSVHFSGELGNFPQAFLLVLFEVHFLLSARSLAHYGLNYFEVLKLTLRVFLRLVTIFELLVTFVIADE